MSEWISVTDRLPDIDERVHSKAFTIDVLVLDKWAPAGDNGTHRGYWFLPTKKCMTVNAGGDTQEIQCDYWMPLPNPPSA